MSKKIFVRERLSMRSIFALVALIAICVAVAVPDAHPESDFVAVSKDLAVCLGCAIFLRIFVSLIPIRRFHRLALIVAIPTTSFLTYAAYLNFGLGYNVSVGLWPIAAYVATCIGTELTFVQLDRRQRSHVHSSS